MATDPLDPVERRRDDYVSVGSATWYLASALGLTVLLIVCAVALVTTQLIMHPELKLDVDQIVKWITVFVGAIIVGLFAGAGIKVVSVLDGQQAMLIRVVAEKERAKGVIEGLKQNPDTNIS
jgi:hypothetical protein